MSWLYSTSRSPHSFGSITKEEGEIKLKPVIHGRVAGRSGYDDYYFVTTNGEAIYLDTWDKPHNGFIRDRSVFLEEEDDEKAIALLTDNITDDIEKLEKRIEHLKHLITSLKVERME